MAQRGHLQFAIESLNKCDPETAISAAQDVRTSGRADSEFGVASLLVEARAIELRGGNARTLYEAYALWNPQIATAEEARTFAEESFGNLTEDCG